MTTFEWFLLIVVVIAVPLIVAVVVTLWTLEQARQRNRKNRPDATGGNLGEPVKRNATRTAGRTGSPAVEPDPDDESAPSGSGRKSEPSI